ncbi:hypothetical protein BCR36DRAFT_412446 [Piromyces finnis]|uniref:Sequence orphan n=1 Tax=Piromyces finnis TaxID=1754191 RepID=A0A1Y1VBI1_9FUNG|nr:hypothetical protein BCR36DRAFT_412446 [Piromyces finnis]|eukprot:ORX50424.1 hypothetical protein BCR36DRAFT_412446 [Piromyces finnis]
MKIYIFPFLLYILLNLSLCYSELVIKEYHLNSKHISHVDGCKRIDNDDNFLVTKYTTVDKKNKQKRDRTPLTEPFEVTFNYTTGTNEQWEIIKESVNYAKELFNSIFDFYTPIKILLQIVNSVENKIAFTEHAVYYQLKKPNEKYGYSYPAPLAKQLITDIPIDFEKNRQHDIIITFNGRSVVRKNNLTPTMVHEMLHGFGFSSLIKRVLNGKFYNDAPSFGREYYMPDILTIGDKDTGMKVIKGFLPINVYEKNFVDIANNNYYFDDSFCSITDIDLNYEIHDPPYYSEKEKLQDLTSYVESWSGMQRGINLYEKSHQPKSTAFKTKDGRLLYVCTFSKSDKPDFNHICSRNMVYESEDVYNIEAEYDENFVMHPYNIGLALSNEEKIQKYGNGKTIGLLSEDIISALETMGYHRKGTPQDNTQYTVVTQVVNTAHTYIDGHFVDDGTSNINQVIQEEEEEDGAFSLSYPSLIYILFITLYSFITLY